jgi:hypothetical protein
MGFGLFAMIPMWGSIYPGPTMLHGFMQNHAGLKKMCKKTRKTSTG